MYFLLFILIYFKTGIYLLTKLVYMAALFMCTCFYSEVYLHTISKKKKTNFVKVSTLYDIHSLNCNLLSEEKLRKNSWYYLQIHI